MRATRRSLLLLPLTGVLAGCSPSPVVQGRPGEAPKPRVPVRSSDAAAVAGWVASFAALTDALARSTASWAAEPVHITWMTALQTQLQAHMSRVVSADPVTGGPMVFPAPDLSAAPPAASTPAEVLALITAEVASGLPILVAGMTASALGQERLLHASLATAANASLIAALPPTDGGAGPAPFEDPDVADALAIALGHVRALVHALEVGLGRLSSDDDLAVGANERLAIIRVLRNTVLAEMDGDLPEVDAWELPNAMSTPQEIRSAWASLETNILNGLGGLVAADGTAAQTWLDAMLAQVPWVHRWGGQLQHWPGWVATL